MFALKENPPFHYLWKILLHVAAANGLCLSPTYHRAYDQGLIYLDEDLIMKLNPIKANELTQVGVGGGLEALQSSLNTRIHLPQDRNQWPSLEFIRAANQFREIG